MIVASASMYYVFALTSVDYAHDISLLPIYFPASLLRMVFIKLHLVSTQLLCASHCSKYFTHINLYSLNTNNKSTYVVLLRVQ